MKNWALPTNTWRCVINIDIFMNIELQKLTSLRHYLHQHPELSGMEERSAAELYKYVQKKKPDEILKNIGGHGMIATWDSEKPGKHIMIRADFDALPITETNDFEHRSVYENVSHKCGHDGHATILCGAANYLSENKISTGKVSLLFQPAEETGQGARIMLEDENFPDYKFDHVFALHNLPGFPLHQIAVKNNSFTPSVTSIIIELKGKTAHAAEPEHGVNPAFALAEILQQVIQLQNNFPGKEDMAVIAPVYMTAGEKAYGVTAGDGSIHFTIRCWTHEKLEALQEQIETISRNIATDNGLQIKISNTETFVANYNEAIATNFVRTAAQNAGLDLKEINAGLKWGEDFGLFSQRFTGCMFGIGSGENCSALHNPDYDFPDEIIETGIKVFAEIIKEINGF